MSGSTYSVSPTAIRVRYFRRLFAESTLGELSCERSLRSSTVTLVFCVRRKTFFLEKMNASDMIHFANKRFASLCSKALSVDYFPDKLCRNQFMGLRYFFQLNWNFIQVSRLDRSPSVEVGRFTRGSLQLSKFGENNIESGFNCTGFCVLVDRKLSKCGAMQH